MPAQRVLAYAADVVDLGEHRTDAAGSEDRADLQAALGGDAGGQGAADDAPAGSRKSCLLHGRAGVDDGDGGGRLRDRRGHDLDAARRFCGRSVGVGARRLGVGGHRCGLRDRLGGDLGDGSRISLADQEDGGRRAHRGHIHRRVASLFDYRVTTHV